MAVCQVLRRRTLRRKLEVFRLQQRDQELAQIAGARDETAGRRLPRRVALLVAAGHAPCPSGRIDLDERGRPLRLAHMREGTVGPGVVVGRREPVGRSRHAQLGEPACAGVLPARFGGDLLHRAEAAQREAEVRVVERVRLVDPGLLFEQAGDECVLRQRGIEVLDEIAGVIGKAGAVAEPLPQAGVQRLRPVELVDEAVADRHGPWVLVRRPQRLWHAGVREQRHRHGLRERRAGKQRLRPDLPRLVHSPSAVAVAEEHLSVTDDDDRKTRRPARPVDFSRRVVGGLTQEPSVRSGGCRR